MKITTQQVERMAGLAKLELTAEEKIKRTREFGDILTYIEKLNAVDVSGVQPITDGTDLFNKFREDEVTREMGESVRERFVKLSPEHTEEFVETISPLK